MIMHKCYWLIASLSLALLLPAAFAQTNLITNPGFETWTGSTTDPPDEWRFFAAGGAVGEVERMEAPADVHSGNYACRFEYTNTWVGGHDLGLDKQGYRFSLTPGSTYRLSFWYKQGRANEDVFRVTIASFDSGGGHLGDFPASNQWWIAAQTDYQQWSSDATGVGDFTAPASAAEGNLAFRLVTTSGGTVILDDVFMYDLAEVTPTPTPTPFTDAHSHWVLYD